MIIVIIIIIIIVIITMTIETLVMISMLTQKSLWYGVRLEINHKNLSYRLY